MTSADKIHKLWLLLTAAKHTRLYGVEENILRWLLKQMSGNTDSAEHVRRFPLTWTILGHIFPKIPAQALGRSLAYSRFVSSLHKALGDVIKEGTRESVTSTEEDVKVAKKRKRGANWPTTLEELRTSLGCIRTASEIFKSLAVLLEQGNTHFGELTPEKRVGAEHIKSLFSSSGEETLDITARLLWVCHNSLLFADEEPIKGQQAWVDTLTTVWNLRLHSKEDSLEFAKHIYERACLTLSNLENDSSVPSSDLPHNAIRAIWTQQLRKFLSTCFIRPARQRFAVDQNLDMLNLALEIAHADTAVSATVMWSIASRMPRDTSDPKSKIEHDAWIESVFQAVLKGLNHLRPRKKNEVLSRLLDIALQTRSIPDTETLNAIYQKHALGKAETDWILLSKILACDPDVFLVAQDPASIFDNISKVSNDDVQIKDEVVSNVVLPLQDAFSKARNLAGFITHWFRSLCAAESLKESIWFDSKIREHLATILQPSLSSAQIIRLLEELESMPDESGQSLIILDGVCSGLTDENTITNVCSKISSMADRKRGELSSDVLALRWRILGHLASWGTSDECNQIWKKNRSDLKSVLKKNTLVATETLEAFSCCYKLCLAHHIGGKYEEDLTKLTGTLVGGVISSAEAEADLQLLRPYIDLVFSHLAKLGEQPKQEVNTLSDQIVKLFWCVSHELPSLSNEERLEYVRLLIQNYDVVDEESMVDALLAPLLDALDSTDNPCGWSQSHSFTLLLVLLEFPVESWTRGRRKRMMNSWKKHKSEINSHVAKDPTYALAVLRLFVKIMQQPTFYEVRFQELELIIWP